MDKWMDEIIKMLVLKRNLFLITDDGEESKEDREAKTAIRRKNTTREINKDVCSVQQYKPLLRIFIEITMCD